MKTLLIPKQIIEGDTKDVLNDYEEIDKLNEEMTTTDEIEEIKNDSNKEKKLEGKDEKIIKESV